MEAEFSPSIGIYITPDRFIGRLCETVEQEPQRS